MVTLLSGAFCVLVLGMCAIPLHARLQPASFRRLAAGVAGGTATATLQVLLIGPAYPLWLTVGGFALVMLVLTRGRLELVLPEVLLDEVPLTDAERTWGRRLVVRTAVTCFVVAVVVAAVVNA